MAAWLAVVPHAQVTEPFVAEGCALARGCPKLDFHTAYRAAHQETVGHESDKWWAKVRRSRPDAFLGRIGAGSINTD